MTLAERVSCQPGQPDAFYHRYVYDAENRITNVLTSADSVNWDNDAFYQYYDHGPLGRTVLGEQQVQGINYAYNLQVWMKAINPDIVTSGYTLKPDGSTGSVVGKSAYNVMLNYFKGDYKAISGAASQDADVKLGSEYHPLYNGNISSMAVNVDALHKPLLYNYQYDQLNRLVAMDAWEKKSNDWSDIAKLANGDFQERVSYDGNGNIVTYSRNGNTAGGKQAEMDKLTYHYKPFTNQLDYVHDTVPAGNYDVDIDAQTAGNFEYDSIGNLVKNVADSIKSINWTVYGKISQIKKDDGTVISYTYGTDGNRISKMVIKPGSTDTARTWYVRDASGNVMSVYESGRPAVNNGHLTQSELHLYGSSRLGLLRRSLDLTKDYAAADTTMPLLGTALSVNFGRGNKLFELSNHLGNVLVTLNDKKLGVSTNNTTIDYFNPQIVSAQDYYPFGMLQPGRSFNAGGYRYGFNGKENDNEVKGEGEQQDYGMRVYDTRLGRFLSVDPLSEKYPFYTPYQFAGNSPILSIDIDGLEGDKNVNNSESSASKEPSTPVNFWDQDPENNEFKKSDIFKEYVKQLKPGETLNKINGVVVFSRESDVSDETKYYWLNGKTWVPFNPQVYTTPIDRNLLKTIFWDAPIKPLLPFEDIDVYASAQVKKSVDVNVFGRKVTGTMVQYGGQVGITSEDDKGFYADFVTVNRSYVNYKIPNTKTEVRVIPFNGSLKTPVPISSAKYGDFKPAIRVLNTIGSYRGADIQAEAMMGRHFSLGLRAKIETPKVAGYSLEVSAGGRAGHLKWPTIVTALYNAVK
ncbi:MULTISPECIES: RHS repeat domain-containing protein [Niastella]|uniref:RHS repeat-associated core domain-containing protein n=1 Tax=Niastella soli TaxID=2821487 RepID=A0ABS3Z2X7_9BACT|nr:RHS repeat-associated core domain-containing protein [Niastella soli]MBO9204509.1 hypothetical protein [Niastella soli]